MGEAKQIAFEEKKSKWEAQQAEFATAKEARQAKSSTNQASKQLNRVSKAARDWDTRSDTSEATVSTMASTAAFSIEEVRCLASKDKEVRKFEKVLREIVKLEEL